VIQGPHGPFLLDVFQAEQTSVEHVIIYAHGFKGFKDWGHSDLLAHWFCARGFHFVKFNFSHNGYGLDGSTELTEKQLFSENTFTKELDELNFVIENCKQAKLPLLKTIPSMTSLMGHSRGGGMSLLAASQDKSIHKLVALAPVNTFENWTTGKIAEDWKNKGVYVVENKRTGQKLNMNYALVEDYHSNISMLRIEDCIEKISCPGLIIHGTEDEAVPLSAAYDIQSKNPLMQVLIAENENHVFGSRHPYLQSKLPLAFLEFLPEIESFLNS